MSRAFKATTYRGAHLDHLAFPMGGLGAGMLCLEGVGALSHVSLRHKPDVFNEPMAFAALHVQGTKTARVLEGPVPRWKLSFPWGTGFQGAGNGLGGKTYGLPRFAQASFQAQFPFGAVSLRDDTMPVEVELTGWSPFVPGDADASSLPVAAVEYRFRNRTRRPLKAVFSFHADNFMRLADAPKEAPKPDVQLMDGGFVLRQAPWEGKPAAEGSFAAFVLDEPATVADAGWFRGGWFDPLTMVWNDVAAGRTIRRGPHAEGDPGRGGSLYVPFTVKAGGEHTLRLLFAWYVPRSEIRVGGECAPAPAGESCGCKELHQPWYARRFASLDEVSTFWREEYDELRDETACFSDCFHDTTLPSVLVEAAAANLAILKSPTCLRQADGRFWAWEGCFDASGGCCHGSCTHVWNYAQALPHLFPALERTLRETEFGVSQDARGHQNFRTSLPIRPPDHGFHAAADGQLGGVIKAYREWRISGDTAWMRALWPSVRQALEYGIETWDPDHTGTVIEPHHNTYDIEFWGPDSLCTGFYLSALQAAIAMGKACGEEVVRYEELMEKGRRVLERDLWNGQYFFQKVQWKNLRAGDPTAKQGWTNNYSPEARVLLEQEGPKYQFGAGCLSDGMLGDWMARVSGLAPVIDRQKVARHLASIYRHNYRTSLASHANTQRPGYGAGEEGGVLLCSWPKGGKPALPFPYSDEVWTGIEYHVAAHLIMLGQAEKGIEIVRTLRARYDGTCRNPFNEVECGHWYARAMSSYSLLQAFGGARYDAVEKTLVLEPACRGDYRAFLSTATGYGTVGVRKGKPFIDVRRGTIPVDRIAYQLPRRVKS